MSASRTRVAVIGAAFSANKGAASMLQAVVDNLPSHLGPCEIHVLTTYPEDDLRERPPDPRNGAIRIVPCTPRQLIFPMLPLALLIGMLRGMGVRSGWLCRTPAVRSLAEATVVLDLAGISFSDGRGFPTLVYNTLMTGIPVLVSRSVVKCSQALGPFREPLNRLAARVLFPRLAAVVARGEQTYRYLEELGLDNAHRGADLAYAMRLSEEDTQEGRRILDRVVGSRPFVGLVPSAVVQKRCEGAGIDYVGIMADFAGRVAHRGDRVLILPHATRPGRPASHMNDLPLAGAIHHRAGEGSCHLLEESLPPAVLRAIIARAEVLVTARFHGLISALATATPPLVLAWSHKYREALAEFDLQEWVVDFGDLSAETLWTRYLALRDRAPLVSAQVRKRLPEVVARAERNFQIVADATRPPVLR